MILFLSFDDMISHTCNKLRSRVAIIQRIRYLIPSDYLSSLYYAFIQPFIDYCILIWGHTSIGNVLRIQRFQNRVARIVAIISLILMSLACQLLSFLAKCKAAT